MKLGDILNYEMDKDRKSSLQMKAVKFLVIFLVLMFLLTIIARAADSVTITKVTTTKASGMAISHNIEVDGSVSSVKDIALSTVANVRIDSVSTAEGKLVSKGDVLFTLNMEDLQKQLRTARKDLKSAQKEIADAKKAKEDQKKAAKKAKEDQKKAAQKAADEAAKARKRAYSDYNDTVKSASNALKRAKKKRDTARKAYRKYKNKKNKKSGTTGKTVAQALQNTFEQKQAAYNKAQSDLTGLKSDIEAQAQDEIKAASVDSSGHAVKLSQSQKQAIRDRVNSSDENQKLLQEAQEKIDTAQSEMEEASAAVEEYSSVQAALSKNSYRERLKALKDEYRSAQDEYEAAKDQYKTSIKEAKRTLSDALDSADSSQDDSTADDTASEDTTGVDNSGSDEESTVDDTDINDKRKTVSTLEKLVKDSGKVSAPSDGLVTKFSAEVGDTTSEDTILRLSDQDAGYSFTGNVEKDSAKYLSKGDRVELDFGNGVNVQGLKISNIEISTDDSSSYTVTVNIPSKVKKISTFATMKVDKASKKYDTCVPLECLHSDGTDYYVYTVSQSKSVLGIEDKVDKVNVNILDKNAENAAIDGSFSYDEDFVLKASKTLNDKDRVRVITDSDGDNNDENGDNSGE